MKCREFGQNSHNKGPHNLYSSPIKITKIKSRKVKWTGNEWEEHTLFWLESQK
jgi:hypothetical protein